MKAKPFQKRVQKVLEDFKDANLHSKAAREAIAKRVVDLLYEVSST